MKIQGAHFEQIKALAVLGRDSLASIGLDRDAYTRRDPRVPRIDRAKDTDMRWRWDCLWEGTRVNKEFGLPCGYDDAHIDTALRKVLMTTPA